MLEHICLFAERMRCYRIDGVPAPALGQRAQRGRDHQPHRARTQME